MADTNAEADIRGIDIDKLAKGFANETLVLKKYVKLSKTKAREIRWYQKTAGFLDSTDTTGITSSQIANVPYKARPVVVEQSWTRTTSYIRKYFVESPWLSEEDIADCDIDILGTNVLDLVKAVSNQVDIRIYAVLTENLTPVNIQTGAATADGWNDKTTGDPILDILTAKEAIRSYRYNPEGAIIYINQAEHKHLLHYLIAVKGSSIPGYSSELIKDGVVMGLLNCKIVVSANATTDYALVFLPGTSATWKTFTPLKAIKIVDEGIGVKIRVLERGEGILIQPKSVYLITDTIV